MQMGLIFSVVGLVAIAGSRNHVKLKSPTDLFEGMMSRSKPNTFRFWENVAVLERNEIAFLAFIQIIISFFGHLFH